MKFLKFLTPILIISILGVFSMENSSAEAFTVSSSSFSNGQTLPQKQVYNQFGCTGGNLSPQLSWQGAPKDTKSFAIVAHDPDAPRANGWYHWIVLNIPANVTSIKEGAQINHPMLEIRNDFGFKHYGGACPPKGHGIHHYNFTVYALSVPGLVPTGAITPDVIHRQIKEKTITSATVTALYSRD